MGASRQNILEIIQNDTIKYGWDIDEQNIQLVIAEGVREVSNSMPRQVRAALNKAVREGRLLHMKKEKHKPEIYCKPQAEFAAKELRGKREAQKVQALKLFIQAGK